MKKSFQQREEFTIAKHIDATPKEKWRCIELHLDICGDADRQVYGN